MVGTSELNQPVPDSMWDMGNLAAEMTHEVRNTLAALRGAGEILRDDFPPEHPKAEFLSILLRELQRLHTMVEAFLGHARGLAQSDEKCFVDLNRLVADTIKLLRCCAGKRRVLLSTEPSVDAAVCGTPCQLQQLVSNLLLNAIQATPPGSTVRVKVELSETSGAGSPVGLVQLLVEDEGPGISEQDLPLLFDPFFTTKEGGSGIGLALSRKVAVTHGGKLTARNRREGGARFTLTLPLGPRRDHGRSSIGRLDRLQVVLPADGLPVGGHTYEER